ncbi:DUF4127 family protein [Streptomyces sp. NPDC001914]|uniref:DUF4127 family protein n=1 Tax=Streptomyces sp. NPDC001914 TaxID=3364623 RepID=UPI0036C84298
MSAEPLRPQSQRPPTLALLPLDERPACTRLPQQIAAVAGARTLVPPAALMPRLRTPGDAEGLGAWLAGCLGQVDGAVVSLETLGYGGLIASRTTRVPAHRVLRRWTALDAYARAGVPVQAVTLVTRTPDSADALEEPDYWNPHGPALHHLSAALHRAEETASAGPAEMPSRQLLPRAVHDDFLGRRLRNHTLNLAALQLVADGVLDAMVVGADDTAVWGLATAELTQLRRWAARLDLGDRVAVRPGADEAVTTLVARFLGHHLDQGPVTVRVESVVPQGLQQTAPYENMTVARTAAGQIGACGARQVTTPDADIYLLVHTPDGAGDWAVAPPAARSPQAAATAAALAERASALLDAGRTVAVADCAQPNGADPLLVTELLRTGAAARLTAYAGWNTAGNTLGTAAAHAVTAVTARRAGTFDPQAHRTLLAHRFLEDWAYMTRVRAQARTALGSILGSHDHVPTGHPVHTLIEHGLAACARELTSMGMEIEPNSLRLPWQRTFEADFDLQPAQDTAPAPSSDLPGTSHANTQEQR